MSDSLDVYTITEPGSVAQLECEEAFKCLSDKEKLYAYHIGQACWEGSKICLLQTSVESVPIFALILRVFGTGPAASYREAAVGAGISEATFDLFLSYCSNFLSNMGNYKGFGDTKFIPGVSPDAFYSVLKASPAYASSGAAIDALWAACNKLMYSLEPRERQLGLGAENGISTYYSSNIEKSDVELVQRFMDSIDLSPYNTRLFKLGDKRYELRCASGATGELPGLTQVATFEGAEIAVTRGDYNVLMSRVCKSLSAAADFAANDTEKSMLECYVRSFGEGLLEEHINGSRHWINDKGPVVESYIGFIESYRDPFGVRGEWEGFVAIVNKEMSAKFGTLVDAAEEMISLLPWGASYEKDSFLRPDFTSLEVLAFASSGIPAGINIPNYDKVRQSEGFKNVSLGNVLSARNLTERVTFLGSPDQEAFRAELGRAFEVQVGLHELLGHGSGKLFIQNADGSFNFDATSTVNPLTGAPVTSFYLPGQTWDSMFGSYASTMEECRAECVGLYLCVEERVLSIFGHSGEEAETIVYINWLNMARAGLLALQFYNPGTKSWGQAHMQARYAILQVLLEAGEGFVEIAGFDTPTDEGDSGVHVKLDKAKIHSVGVPAIRKFLTSLQVYKSTAAVADAKTFYDRYTAVPEPWIALRSLVVAKRKPRPLFVQPVMSLTADGVVEFTKFPATHAGILDSFTARFGATDLELEAYWETDKATMLL